MFNWALIIFFQFGQNETVTDFVDERLTGMLKNYVTWNSEMIIISSSILRKMRNSY